LKQKEYLFLLCIAQTMSCFRCRGVSLASGLTLPGRKVTKDLAPAYSATCSRSMAKLKEFASAQTAFNFTPFRAAGARLVTDGAGKRNRFNTFWLAGAAQKMTVSQ